MDSFEELERRVHEALETYSNVHRGSGHNSMVSTRLFEQAREIVLEHLGLNKGKYVVIFCTPRRAETLMAQLKPGSYHILSSRETGLSLGVRALAVKRKMLPGGTPFETGGGTTRLISSDWVIWADAPDKFEAGTPAIINIIAFARALMLMQYSGNEVFRTEPAEKLTASDILYHDELEKYSGKELLDKLQQTLIGRGNTVPTTEGPKPFINLDNAASTPAFEPVWKAVCQAWRQPAEAHQEIIDEVRSVCARALGAPQSEYDMIFTSNTTEAINLAAESLKGESDPGIEPVVLNTLVEHNSNDLPWRMNNQWSLIRLPADDDGFFDLVEMERFLCEYNQQGLFGKKRIRLVTVSGASNVLTVYNNLEEISPIVHRYGARLMVDAAQLVAHRKVDMGLSGIDYLAFSAHKVYAPFGTGMLVAGKGLLSFSPDEMKLIRSSGEENVAGIAALGKALVLLQRIGMDVVMEEEQRLTRRALLGMAQIEGLSVFGIKDPDSPGFDLKGSIIMINLKNMMANRLARELAERGGIGTRYGCHCAHMIIKRMANITPFLEKFQRMLVTLFPGLKLPGLLRVSLGIENTEEDIDTLIYTLKKIRTTTRKRKTKRNKKTDE